MIKRDLAERIMVEFEKIAEARGERCFLMQKDASSIVDAILDAIGESLERGERVELRGFGTFKTTERKARVARNPHTNEKLEIPAKIIPVFKASPKLKNRVNK